MAKIAKQSTARTKKVLSITTSGYSEDSFDVSLLYDKTALLRIPFRARILSVKDAGGYTLLHHASDLGCPDALELLLAKKGEQLESYIHTSSVHLTILLY